MKNNYRLTPFSDTHHAYSYYVVMLEDVSERFAKDTALKMLENNSAFHAVHIDTYSLVTTVTRK